MDVFGLNGYKIVESAMSNLLDTPPPATKVLVLTTRKHVWADSASAIFPHTLYTWQVCGYSTNLLNSLLLFARVLPIIWWRRPQVILVASAARLQGWLAQCRRRGIIRSQLVVINRGYPAHLAPYIDRCTHDTVLEAEYHGDHEGKEKHVFVPWGIDFFRELESRARTHPLAAESFEPYVLVPGWSGRDFPTLFAAAEKLPDIPFRITTLSRETIDVPDPWPPNVSARYSLPEPEFIDELYGCRCVAMPLKPHPTRVHLSGGGTVVKVLQAGKPLITQGYHQDYMTDGEHGTFVPSQDAAALATAIRMYWDNPERAAKMAPACREAGNRFTYKTYAEGLAAVCREVQETE